MVNIGKVIYAHSHDCALNVNIMRKKTVQYQFLFFTATLKYLEMAR